MIDIQVYRSAQDRGNPTFLSDFRELAHFCIPECHSYWAVIFSQVHGNRDRKVKFPGSCALLYTCLLLLVGGWDTWDFRDLVHLCIPECHSYWAAGTRGIFGILCTSVYLNVTLIGWWYLVKCTEIATTKLDFRVLAHFCTPECQSFWAKNGG